MTRPLRVLHLVGSAESDFFADLSRHYAENCLAVNSDPEAYEFLIAYVTPDGRWRFPCGLGADAIADAQPLAPPAAISALGDLGIDVMVPQMFCLPGMTHYRALFDVLGIPYVGNPPDVMALTAHKARAKAVVARAGVRVPDGEVLHAGQTPSLSPPCVVKPVAADNSLALALVRDPSEYPRALDAAWQHGPALVETYIELGREVRGGTIVRHAHVVALPLEEYAVDPEHRPVRDRAAKYTHDADGVVRLVAKNNALAWIVDADDPATAAVHEASLRCHAALGCRHYGLFDFRIDPDGHPWFLEAGLYCSFAEQSVISVMARAAGIALPQLFDDALREALADAAAPRITVR